MTERDAADRWPAALDTLLEMLAGDDAPVSRASGRRARDVHIRDSLSGLELDELRDAGRIADVGSGAGLPGLVIAASVPGAQVDLVESVSCNCDFMREAIERMALANAAVVCKRAEEWGIAGEPGHEAYDAVTARAVGGLAEMAELASPLLHDGGLLVAWRGARDPEDERRAAAAVPRTAVEPADVCSVTPYEGSRDRHIHLLRKNGPTPNDLPRRPGMAAKRPFGHE